MAKNDNKNVVKILKAPNGVLSDAQRWVRPVFHLSISNSAAVNIAYATVGSYAL